MINKKIIIICVVVFALLFVGFSVYLLIPRSYVVFQTAPEQVAVIIDKNSKRVVTNGDNVTISPGKHKITVFRDEFNPFTTDIDIKNGETMQVVAALEALTEAASKLLENSKSSMVIEKSTGIRMDKEVNSMEESNPILKVLPIEELRYVVTSCPSELYPDNPTRFALCVDIQSDEYKEIVKDDIKARGFNPDSFEYIWNNYLSGVE